MKFTFTLFFSWVLLLSHLPGARAQVQARKLIKHWNIKDGLSQGVVNSIVQDKRGLLWFATEDGLNQFNGYSFRTYQYDPDSKTSIADNFVQSILTDTEGTLWVSSRKGLLEFDAAHETFVPYQHRFGRKDEYAFNDVSVIAEGSAGNLWIGWYGSGFASFDKKKKVFVPYTPETLPGLSNEKTVAMLEDSFGLLWVGTQQGGMDVFQVSGGRVTKKMPHLSGTGHLPSANVHCFAQDTFGNIWIGTSQGLVVYKRQENKFYVFNDPKFIIAQTHIYSLLVDSNENLWIGSQGKGLYQLDLRQWNTRLPDDFVVTRIKSLGDVDISRRTIQCIYEDKDRNVWLGTFGDGAYFVSSASENFIRVQKPIYENSAVSLVSYYGLCDDQKGHLWMGTDGNGIYQTDLDGQVIRHYTAEQKHTGLKDNALLSAFRDAQGRLWFGSYAQGLFLYDKSSDSFPNYRYKGSQGNKNIGNDVRVIFQDSKGNIWVGTNRGGLCLLDEQGKHYANPAHFKGALLEGDVRSITEDADGNLWIGFYGDGVYSYAPATRTFRRHFGEAHAKEQLKSDIVFAIKADRNGKIWMGTGGSGLCVFDPKAKTFKRYTEKDGLANNTIYTILTDKNDNVWVSTNLGISKLEVREQAFLNYDVSDGLQEGQFNPGSAMYNEVGGYMCMGGTHGMNIFYPDQIRATTQTPPVLISGLLLFNKPVRINDTVDGRPILTQAISQTRHITLAHDQNVLTFEFVGVNYNYPEKNHYSYMLEGLDDDWNSVGNARTATYRYLKPGSYVFKVKTATRANAWTADYASIAITIRPPFWLSPLAYLLYVLTLGGIGFVVFSVTRKQLKLKRRLMIERKHRKYEHQLAHQKLTFFTEISHEFKTPLTLMLGPLEEMLSDQMDSAASARKLQMVHRNAHKLLTLINKLLDYRKLESGKVVVKAQPGNLVEFVHEIATTFRELADHKGLAFHVQADQPVIEAWFDREKMEMVLNNLISNSFKYIGKGTKIHVCLTTQVTDKYPQGRAVIKIKDNGVGIPRKQQGAIFDWFHQGASSGSMSSGIGLSLAKKLVHLHKGEIYVESKEGIGSTFSIKIPLGNAHFRPEELVADVQVESVCEAVVLEPGSSPAVHPVELPEDPLGLSALPDTGEGTGHGTKKGYRSLLVVEDDEEIRQFLREFFEKDYKIYEAANGREGYDLAMSCHPDLVISDIMMPEVDGIQFCRKIKENIRTSHIPVILLTARSGLSSHKEGMETGADAYLTKPFSVEILRLTVHNLLESQQKLMRFYRNLFSAESTTNEEAGKVSNPLDEKFLRSIYEMLKTHMDNPEFTIEDLADVLNMSRSLVYKKVKMLTGLSPNEYLRSLRLAEAARLLKTRQYKVFEVVYMVGFTDLKYFRQCFAREFGCSPSEFVKQAQPVGPAA
jgi:signal transduction histidine kinase/ligand-binding sensor domain-containing protein/DNA-binding response OmpR family regulator